MNIDKKKLMVSFLAAGVLTTSTAFAAQNPFESVPRDSWSYTAVEKLVEDGLVDGYDLSDFHDKKVAARYDVAQFVARAMANEEKAGDEDKALLSKLKSEYDNELKIMMAVPASLPLSRRLPLNKKAAKIKSLGSAIREFAISAITKRICRETTKAIFRKAAA